jgi:hypothetical protein
MTTAGTDDKTEVLTVGESAGILRTTRNAAHAHAHMARHLRPYRSALRRTAQRA